MEWEIFSGIGRRFLNVQYILKLALNSLSLYVRLMLYAPHVLTPFLFVQKQLETAIRRRSEGPREAWSQLLGVAGGPQGRTHCRLGGAEPTRPPHPVRSFHLSRSNSKLDSVFNRAQFAGGIQADADGSFALYGVLKLEESGGDRLLRRYGRFLRAPYPGRRLGRSTGAMLVNFALRPLPVGRRKDGILAFRTLEAQLRGRVPGNGVGAVGK